MEDQRDDPSAGLPHVGGRGFTTALWLLPRTPPSPHVPQLNAQASAAAPPQRRPPASTGCCITAPLYTRPAGSSDGQIGAARARRRLRWRRYGVGTDRSTRSRRRGGGAHATRETYTCRRTSTRSTPRAPTLHRRPLRVQACRRSKSSLTGCWAARVCHIAQLLVTRAHGRWHSSQGAVPWTASRGATCYART